VESWGWSGRLSWWVKWLHLATKNYTKKCRAPTDGKYEDFAMNMIRQAVTSKFVTWASRSLLGDVVLFEILLGLPLFVTFTYMDYIRDILALDRMMFVCTIMCGGRIDTWSHHLVWCDTAGDQ